MRRSPFAFCLLVLASGSVHPLAGQGDAVRRGPLLPFIPQPVLYTSPVLPSPNPASELRRLGPALEDGDVAVVELCRAAHLALTLGVLEESEDHRVALLREAESYARRALQAQPGDRDALFLEGAALGLLAQHVPVKERIRLAERIRANAWTILAEEPGHPGALHLNGRLNATAMRINPMVRFLARQVLGAELLDEASWAEAEDSFRRALAAEPWNLAHRLELARLLHDTGRNDEAMAELFRIVDSDRSDPLSEHYQRLARLELAEIAKR